LLVFSILLDIAIDRPITGYSWCISPIHTTDTLLKGFSLHCTVSSSTALIWAIHPKKYHWVLIY
jgi:hypothetical protein